MAQLQIKLKNEALIIAAFRSAPGEVGKRIQKAINRAGIFLAGKVKENITSGEGMYKAPIDTGAMRRGINATFTPLTATVAPSFATPYAAYVHEGTKYMPARPFFDITLNKDGDETVKFLQEELDGLVKDIARKID